MYLAEFQVFNYKGFLDSGPIKLKPGFNVLTGQNNSGKTALLEALSLQFPSKPHRSLVNAPSSGSPSVPQSRALFRVAITPDELRKHLKDGNVGAILPILRSDFPGVSDGAYLWHALCSRQG
ncbi:MAG TPA: AAA family ATPase, partial [Archangium sp.]|uniref:AAA family ATPase n=1 Tax=Archangium sp. TaxID=1872627 RepID=UPI002EDA32F7